MCKGFIQVPSKRASCLVLLVYTHFESRQITGFPYLPRWKLRLPDDCQRVFTTYMGLQQHDSDSRANSARLDIVNAIQDWIQRNKALVVSESFDMIGGQDMKDQNYNALDLLQIYHTLDSSASDVIGIWQESFVTETSRLETYYSGLDYLPGLARLQGASSDMNAQSSCIVLPNPGDVAAKQW
ncbi:predicted protein [Plenodomus lingam JN3]|uniref:Predicted protein n=1 Tax=Leptosphaeria maculans (strain JN3 / isolate v23.1.3 / race Av1-4-5-6-7-8) TaxID=985895 RepID=E5A3W0_LEPMJ|nr:predicted protein [Plenodomus lingam JN3]CBX97984.1 predicted protein [Plenodomus lingam JN3]